MLSPQKVIRKFYLLQEWLINLTIFLVYNMSYESERLSDVILIYFDEMFFGP